MTDDIVSIVTEDDGRIFARIMTRDFFGDPQQMRYWISEEVVDRLLNELLAIKCAKSNDEKGLWHATTMGVFLQLLVDSGVNEAILFRVIEKKDYPDDKGLFASRMEVVVVPDGHVLDEMTQRTPIHTNNILAKLLKARLLK